MRGNEGQEFGRDFGVAGVDELVFMVASDSTREQKTTSAALPVRRWSH